MAISFASLPVVVALVAALFGGVASSTEVDRADPNPVHSQLHFTENRGQLPDGVFFHVEGADKSVRFLDSSVEYHLHGDADWTVSQEFLGAATGKPVGEDIRRMVVSYFYGPPTSWIRGASTFGTIRYPQLWPGIDLTYRGEAGQLKYEFVLAPGADPSRVGFRYRGVSEMVVTETQELRISTPVATLTDEKPYAYQLQGDRQIAVDMAYRVTPEPEEGSWQLRFELGPYDESLPLVMDPSMLVYCGFIAGAFGSCGNAIAVDDDGYAYVAGNTSSSEVEGFPVVVGPDLSQNGQDDAFIAKVTPDGSELVYCGFIGGAFLDGANAVAVDSQGRAYVAGGTNSRQTDGFPVTVGPDLTFNGNQAFSDAFIARVSADGTDLEYCGYIGGRFAEAVQGIAVDDQGRAFVTGSTQSEEGTFPVLVGPDLTFNGDRDCFVARVATDGSQLEYCGYIGGDDQEFGRSIDIDDNGRAYVGGETRSEETGGFPVLVGPDLTFNGDEEDGFVARVAATGVSLDYCGYVGGSRNDGVRGIAVDPVLGKVHIGGYTRSEETSFPVTVGPDLTWNGGTDLFVGRLTTDGSEFEFCGYVGGSSTDQADQTNQCIGIDAEGCVYLLGRTTSDGASLPLREGPDLTYNSGGDSLVCKVSADGTTVLYCGYLGGFEQDAPRAIAVDDAGNAYITGETRSDQATFPVIAGPELMKSSFEDAFVARIPAEFPIEATCMLGSVSFGGGFSPADVLWINMSAGNGATRVVEASIASPIEIIMDAPPSAAGEAPFVLYAWLREPGSATVSPQPFGVGTMCLPTLLTVGLPKPRFIWNNIGMEQHLGEADFPSMPAPTTVMSRMNGVDEPLIATFQGIILDGASAGSKPASVTNAIVLKVE